MIHKMASRQLVTFFVILTLSACTAQLAPEYDQALFEGLTRTNAQIMELFASVSAGTEADTFSERETAYNSAIGRIDALALQSRARPVPDNAITEKVNEYLLSRGIETLADGEAPSAAALEVISKNLAKMKQTDADRGLKTGAIAVFRSAVVISMDQAVTYEAFLKR